MLIFNNYYTPAIAICPAEQRPSVEEDTDYDYGVQSLPTPTSLLPADGWDWDFSCDITGKEASARTGKWKSNLSYASAALTPNRVLQGWGDLTDSRRVVFADRGPRDGSMANSPTGTFNHATRAGWRGVLGFADGHAEQFTQRSTLGLAFVLPGMEKSINGKPDNIFAEDDPDTGSDIYLSVWGDCIDGNLQALWD